MFDVPDEVVGEGSRRLFGYIEAFSIRSEQPKARLEIVFDAVEQDNFSSERPLGQSRLSIVRVSTSIARLSEYIPFAEALSEGVWVALVLGKKKGNPPAWVLDAANDYSGPPTRLNLIEASVIFDADSRGGVGIGRSRLRSDLMAFCKVSTVGTFSPISIASSQLRVRALDVGHASCVAIHAGRSRASPIVAYFDVGAPVFFHRMTFPSGFDPTPGLDDAGVVILSHWDFDHYSLAVTRWKQLQKVSWIAPEQEVGPNAARLQELLGARLAKVSASTLSPFTGATMWKGLGSPGDKNESGYTLRIDSGYHHVLLTGDVGYASIPPSATIDITGLVVCHHGGKGASHPPSAKPGGRAVVSYGLPNRYGHPDEGNLEQHGVAGWHIRRTAGDRLLARGDRWVN